MKRRSLLGAMLAACVAPAFIKDGIAREVLMPITHGWKATESGILVQETSAGGLIMPRFIAVDLIRGLAEPVANPLDGNFSNVMMHPKLAERLYVGTVDSAVAFNIVMHELALASKLEPRPNPVGVRLLRAMRESG